MIARKKLTTAMMAAVKSRYPWRIPTSTANVLYLVSLLLVLYDVSSFTSIASSSSRTRRTENTWAARQKMALQSTTTPSKASDPSSVEDSFKAPQEEIDRRRNLAIISHPDSGKTTMTEKLLLYGGALQQAGAVRQKAEQRTTQSDFMAIEQERGISISSTVMNFEYGGFGIRLMDTPGHNDFRYEPFVGWSSSRSLRRSIQ